MCAILLDLKRIKKIKKALYELRLSSEDNTKLDNCPVDLDSFMGSYNYYKKFFLYACDKLRCGPLEMQGYFDDMIWEIKQKEEYCLMRANFQFVEALDDDAGEFRDILCSIRPQIERLISIMNEYIKRPYSWEEHDEEN